MRKQILGLFIVISMISSNCIVAAAEEKTLSGGEAGAVLGGLLLVGLISQSISKSKEAAAAEVTRKATKTIEMKPKHSYLWSTGSDDKAPLIEYV